MYNLTVTDHFDSSHHLRGYEGACARPHGHRFVVTVTVQSEEVNELGMVVDFKTVKSILKTRAIDRLDHYDINEVKPFDTINPTAENLAAWIYDQLSKFPEPLWGLYSVRVYESPECYIEYMP